MSISHFISSPAASRSCLSYQQVEEDGGGISARPKKETAAPVFIHHWILLMKDQDIFQLRSGVLRRYQGIFSRGYSDKK